MNVTKMLSLALLLTPATQAVARGVPTWKYKPSAIVNVTITENAAIDPLSSAQDLEQCFGFVVTANVVKSYFRNAFPISQIDTHDYQWSRCMSTGRIEFANGDKGEWKIKSSRLGFLNLDDGHGYAFFCRDTVCRDKVYEYWRGVNSDSESAAEDAALERAEARKRKQQATAKRRTQHK